MKNPQTNKHTLPHMQIHTTREHTDNTQTHSGRMEGWTDKGEERWKRDRYSSDRQRDGWTEGWRE